MKSSADTFITTIQKYNNPNNNYTGADSEEDDNDDDQKLKNEKISYTNKTQTRINVQYCCEILMYIS